MDQQDLYIALKNKALVLLSMREHSELELSRKLMISARAEASERQDQNLKNLIPDLLQDLLQELISKNYLSDTRYAEAYILSRARKGYGPNYIKQALRQVGVAHELIQAVLEKLENNSGSDFDLNWSEIALKILNKKFKSLDFKNYKNIQQAQRFLYSRGFGMDDFDLKRLKES